MDHLNPTIEDLLQQFQSVIGVDFDKYKNHVYRVFLNCMLQDNALANTEKYAIAAVFHDIGIWTDHTIDYLEPSIFQLKNYLKTVSKEAWMDEIALMIYWHHKVSSYKGDYERTVEIFRRADWTDVTFGAVAFGMNRKTLSLNRQLFPNAGFHAFLIKKLTVNFFKSPFNPLPMFTR